MIYALDGDAPVIHPSCWIADSASVIGRVTLGRDIGIWFGAVLRGDNDSITVGDGSNVQEGVVLHIDAGLPLTIGRNVTVGHQAMLHGCTIGDGSLIGIKAVVLNRAMVGRNCLIGANALVTEDKVIPDGSLVLGSPGKVVRALTPQELELLARSAEHYQEKARHYRDALKAL